MMTRRVKQAVEIFGKPFMLVIVIGANHFGLDFSETFSICILDLSCMLTLFSLLWHHSD